MNNHLTIDNNYFLTIDNVSRRHCQCKHQETTCHCFSDGGRVEVHGGGSESIWPWPGQSGYYDYVGLWQGASKEDTVHEGHGQAPYVFLQVNPPSPRHGLG